MKAAGTRAAVGGRAHTLVIFDRHAKLPISSGNVPLTTGPAVPVRHDVAKSRARVRIGRTRPELARRAGAVGRAAPLPRADRDRVHFACKAVCGDSVELMLSIGQADGRNYGRHDRAIARE
jgi:hypothetical protein